MLNDGDIMRNILLYIKGIFILLTMSMTTGCGSSESRPDAKDSIYSVEYIYSITIGNPERALALLDTVEQKNLISKFDIARLRCLAYHIGLSEYKMHYATDLRLTICRNHVKTHRFSSLFLKSLLMVTIRTATMKRVCAFVLRD